MEPERETLELDVLFVGAGPASLAGAYHLARLAAEQKLEVSIAVLEKGKEIGSHALSGAVVDPRALRELFPEDWRSAPFEAPVEHERLLWLTGKHALPLPIPPPLENEGNYVASLGKLLKWMAPKVEAAGVDIFYEFPAVAVLMDGERGDRVVGVRTGDRGVGRDGRRKANYEPGVDIRAKVTVLGEGPRGTLAKQLEERLGLAEGRNPQVYSIGLKEVWDLPHGRVEPGQVIHTMGWPLGLHTFGGGFIYGMQGGMQGDQAIVGLVVGLDYENPLLDPHVLFQRFKTHPEIAGLLDGGRMAFYGAKAIPEGGLVGDAAALRRRVPDRRRLGGPAQQPALEGHPPGDEVGDAGGGDDLRGAPRGRARRRAAGGLRAEDRGELGARGAVGGAQLPPGLRPRRRGGDVPGGGRAW